MAFIIWLVVGTAAGWIAGIVVKGAGFGLKIVGSPGGVSHGKANFPDYVYGCDGPKAADELLAREGDHAWRP